MDIELTLWEFDGPIVELSVTVVKGSPRHGFIPLLGFIRTPFWPTSLSSSDHLGLLFFFVGLAEYENKNKCAVYIVINCEKSELSMFLLFLNSSPFSTPIRSTFQPEIFQHKEMCVC